MKYFLGLEIARNHQGFLASKPSKLPMDPTLHLNTSDGSPIPDPSIYRRLVGRLIYLTISRPDISFPVNKLSQFMQEPRSTHMTAAHNLLRYLKGTIVFLGDSLISWKSKKQPTVSKSSTEAEYRSLSAAASETIWLQRLLTVFEVHVPSAYVLCDNMSAIYLASNPVHHERTKYIDIDHHFIRELVNKKQLKVLHVKREHQVADFFTKALPAPMFKIFSSKLGIHNIFLPT
uniref:Retrovirus-related Pol polyprotein from transposon TNT 1-94 n=1 Tax=Cajanus cajan TaxID=3821 RepID=A0A151QT02_CAJCA|nr:Retrovirus-related Pol polyprotein from transposon TNT 1-94 [Cajanus cajan]